MDNFLKIADTVVIYHIKTVWLEMEKMYNKVAAEKGGSLSAGFALLAIDKLGTPVTKIAPRLGLEPNSLSRLLKSMENKKLISRTGMSGQGTSTRLIETNELLCFWTQNHYTAPRNQRNLIFYDTESLRSPTKPTNSHILRHRINTQPN